MTVHLGAYEKGRLKYPSTTGRREESLSASGTATIRSGSPNRTALIDRLGWLDLPSTMREETSAITAFADEVRRAGFHHVVLFGMGGSSLGGGGAPADVRSVSITRSSSSYWTPRFPKR